MWESRAVWVDLFLPNMEKDGSLCEFSHQQPYPIFLSHSLCYSMNLQELKISTEFVNSWCLLDLIIINVSLNSKRNYKT
jgi:hypothetical protein